jgi:hypothetical protein
VAVVQEETELLVSLETLQHRVWVVQVVFMT